ncbi:hypothetical protein Prubr_49380 [Polymorphospora rubra]|uniref:Uncharacterized protein n=1 Tax=Polymorphospora rubra TaxID=338584 RepID=A0A810N3K4_9ACTN|nr:hypothetical protein Prubr_49380 [Polymorphospora rubra]
MRHTGVVSDSAVVRLRPRRIRKTCWALAAAVVVLFTVVGTALRGPTGEGMGSFQRGDQFAMIGLGVLIAAGILMFTRPGSRPMPGGSGSATWSAPGTCHGMSSGLSGSTGARHGPAWNCTTTS